MTFSCTSANVEIWVKNPAEGKAGQEQTGRPATVEPTSATTSQPLISPSSFPFYTLDVPTAITRFMSHVFMLENVSKQRNTIKINHNPQPPEEGPVGPVEQQSLTSGLWTTDVP